MASKGLKAVGAVSGLGFEIVALVVVGVLAGDWVDGRFGTKPWGVMVGLALALFGAGYHVWLLVRWLESGDDGEERE